MANVTDTQIFGLQGPISINCLKLTDRFVCTYKLRREMITPHTTFERSFHSSIFSLENSLQALNS